MFQLTTPLTPAPGRAGTIGVSGAGSGRNAVDGPDFLTFALPGAPGAAPGKTRQNPAGGGEAVPGGAVIAPPAGQPDTPEAASETEITLVSPIAAQPVGAEMTDGVGEPVPADAFPLRPAKAPASAGDLSSAAPKKTRSAPSSNGPIRSSGQSADGVAGAVARRETDDTDTDPAPIDSSDILDAGATCDAARMQPVPAQFDPPAVEARAPIVGGSPDTASPAPVFAPPAAAPKGATDQPHPVAEPGRPRVEMPLAPVALRDAQPHVVPSAREAVVGAPIAPPRLPGAGHAVLETPLLVTPARDAAGRVSLGTIARMLGAVAPAPTAPTVSAAASTPAAALPAMPASVARFLASVAPGPRATPPADLMAKPAPRAVIDGAVVSTPSPTTAAPGPAPAVAQPAGQLFAEAIHAATGQRDRPYRATVEDLVAPAVAASPSAPTATAAIADRAPLDITQAHWPMKMIERIEVLRDAADAQDTRIKLIPDALGAIDVSMKRDGDTVRVHLAAERPETRAILADAQPRLAELGEQRGLKIAASSGQASGQASPQDFHQPRGQAAPQQPARPVSARAGDQPATDDDGDQRLA